MAQGTLKKPSVKPNLKASHHPTKTKKGARVAKSKKTSSADKMAKKLAAGLTAKTEKLLGERAGHLELIGKGRDRKHDGKKEGKNAGGGSRKFG